MLAEQQMENGNTDQGIHLQRTEQRLTRIVVLVSVCVCVCVRALQKVMFTLYFSSFNDALLTTSSTDRMMNSEGCGKKLSFPIFFPSERGK
jgi:hypothetical protein